EEKTVPSWVSKDIRKPSIFTVTTYQALHSAISQDNNTDWRISSDNHDGETLDDTSPSINSSTKKASPNFHVHSDDTIEFLLSVPIGTVVIDEAHHLRNSWWKSLTFLLSQLNDIKLVALTATPPYDVTDFEWKRYIDLCGPVDAEVSVPELVKEGDLCPHQDLVILSTPLEEEDKEIRNFRDNVTRFVDQLKENELFLQYLCSHKWIVSPEIYEEEILERPGFYSSILVFLHSKKIEISEYAIKLVAGSLIDVPKISLEWLEILLEGLLFPPDVKKTSLPIVLLEILEELRKIGAIEMKRVTLRKNKRIENLLRQSVSKCFKLLILCE
ncbi:MAG: DEAD/DEAH box helicase family protein, partial [Candidatus Thorarchaeota archaeon]|nr:DEAD/DEAH box helicase family protein [Candidatus Thorarchaeota archaeon]